MSRGVVDPLLTNTAPFAALLRELSVASEERIFYKLEQIASRLDEITSAGDYEKLHKDFCEWFLRGIRTAQQTPASFGQAAGVLDTALKACVLWGALPSREVAARIRPFLHGVLDGPIMDHLKAKYHEPISARTIGQVDESIYQSLQTLLARDARESFPNNVPVEYDGLIWERLVHKALRPCHI